MSSDSVDAARFGWDVESRRFFYHDKRTNRMIFPGGTSLPARPAERQPAAALSSDEQKPIDQHSPLRFEYPRTQISTADESLDHGGSQSLDPISNKTSTPKTEIKSDFGIMSGSNLPFSNNEEVERLYSSFRRRKSNFFRVGRVFLVLWVEPAGDTQTSISDVGPSGPEYARGRYGQSVYSKVRRLVIIREGSHSCLALPIATYGGRGVGKHGVIKSDHAVVYTGRHPPQIQENEVPKRGEEGMNPFAIRIDPDQPGDRLDPRSRLNYSRIYTVDHNIKVEPFGLINRNSLDAFVEQFNVIWFKRSKPHPPSGDVEKATTKASLNVKRSDDATTQPPETVSDSNPTMTEIPHHAYHAYHRLKARSFSSLEASQFIFPELEQSTEQLKVLSAVENAPKSLGANQGKSQNIVYDSSKAPKSGGWATFRWPENLSETRISGPIEPQHPRTAAIQSTAASTVERSDQRILSDSGYVGSSKQSKTGISEEYRQDGSSSISGRNTEPDPDPLLGQLGAGQHHELQLWFERQAQPAPDPLNSEYWTAYSETDLELVLDLISTELANRKVDLMTNPILSGKAIEAQRLSEVVSIFEKLTIIGAAGSRPQETGVIVDDWEEELDRFRIFSSSWDAMLKDQNLDTKESDATFQALCEAVATNLDLIQSHLEEVLAVVTLQRKTYDVDGEHDSQENELEMPLRCTRVHEAISDINQMLKAFKQHHRLMQAAPLTQSQDLTDRIAACKTVQDHLGLHHQEVEIPIARLLAKRAANEDLRGLSCPICRVSLAS